MENVEEVIDEILEMFDGASTVNYTKEALISFLQEVSEKACSETAGAIAYDLLGKIDRFSNVYCSDKQAYVLACAAVEYGIKRWS